MNTLLDNSIKQSELLNRLVLDFNTTEKIGRVKKLWLDVESHQVKGLTCTVSFFKRDKLFLTWDKITSIGNDSILAQIDDAIVEQPKKVDNVIGVEVWTDAGNKVGKLINYCVDLTSGAVVAYLYTSNGWRGITDGTYVLNPDAVRIFGIERIIVTEASMKDPQQYEEGLNEKVQQAKEFIQEDLANSQKDFSVAIQNTQGLATQLQKKAQSATDVAKEKLSDTASQLQKATQEVSSQAKEKLAEFKEKGSEAESTEETEDRFLLYRADSDEEEETSPI